MKAAALLWLLAFAAAACTDRSARAPIDALAAPAAAARADGWPTEPLPAHCHSAYWPCVPLANDVDCAGGPGDGPEFVSGPIDVITHDPYELDDDRDGLACEPE